MRSLRSFKHCCSLVYVTMFGIMVGLGIYPTMTSSCAEELTGLRLLLVGEGGDVGRGGHTLGRHLFSFLFSDPFLLSLVFILVFLPFFFRPSCSQVRVLLYSILHN